MRKLVLLFAVLGMAGYVHAFLPQITWSNSVAVYDWSGTLVPGNSSWIVRMYESTDSTINFAGLLSTGDDTYTSNQFVFGVSGLADGFGKTTISNPANITSGDKLYSVIFNSSDVLTATKWAVIDSAVATVSYTPNPFNYNPGGVVAGDWQAVPEPATALLFGIGGIGAWLVRRNKKMQSQEDIEG